MTLRTISILLRCGKVRFETGQNGALVQMFGAERVSRAAVLEDLFPAEDAKEVHYLMNRARRTGLASSQVDLKQERQIPMSSEQRTLWGIDLLNVARSDLPAITHIEIKKCRQS